MTTALLPPRLFSPSRDQSLVPEIAQIHSTCITHDNQLLTFLPPLSTPKIETCWRNLVSRIETGEVALILQFAATTDAHGQDVEGEGELAGCVCLVMPVNETEPFKGMVEKLMVSPRHRRKGVARRVMVFLEEVARGKGRVLLTLDTTVGTEADSMNVYQRLEYIECGLIPKYGVSPKDGSLVDERFFYKDLRNC